MISFSEHLIVTKELNEVICRYARKILLKEFLLEFAFPKSKNGKRKLTTRNLNPFLEELGFHQGDIYGVIELDIKEFISKYISSLDQNDKISLYFLILNENYLSYYEDFLANDGAQLKSDVIDKEFGKELGYKVYNSDAAGLGDDLDEFLQNKISSFANEIDLTDINKNTIEDILEAIESQCKNMGNFFMR